MPLLGQAYSTVACGCGWGITYAHNDKTKNNMALRLHQKVCRGGKNLEMVNKLSRESDNKAKSGGGGGDFREYFLHTEGKGKGKDKVIETYEKVIKK
jgi:hypothetical protein